MDNSLVSGPAAKAAGARSPRYAIGLLFVVYALSFLDRQIINILAEPIKHDLGLEDWQLGALTGLSFAIFYTTLAIPIARLADRVHRGHLISVALLIWSGFTALCGTATSFAQLLMFRTGVGFGEAGCSPAAQSLITDLTTKTTRARAMAIYALGVPIGSLLGMVIGGLAVDVWGWRHSLMFVGLPGVFVSAIAYLTLHDPRAKQAAHDGLRQPERADVPPLGAALRELRGKRSFWWLSFGSALTSFVGYGHQAFFASFFLRNHAAEVAEQAAHFGLGIRGLLGVALGLLLGIGGSLGTLFGGVVADRLALRGPQAYALVPAVATVLACPLYVMAFLLPSGTWAILLLLLPTVLKNMWFGPVFTGIQAIVHQRSRATATAIFLFILNTFGLGMGAICIGALSDVLSTRFGPAEGLRWAMVVLTSVCLISGYCFWRARTLIEADLVAS